MTKCLWFLTNALILIGLSATSVSANVNSWSKVGTQLPRTIGRILCLTTPSEGVLLAGTWFSGAFRSQDHGMTWQPFSPASETVSIILVHPTRLEEIYVGTLEGLLKTTDNGESWTTILDQAIFSLAFDPTKPSILYAGTSEGVFKSLNAGSLWKQNSNGLETEESILPFIRGLVVNPSNPQILYLIASNSNRHQMSVFLGDGQEVPRNKNSRFGLFKTTDGAENWLRLETGLPPEEGDIVGSSPYNAPSTESLALAYTDPEIIYYTNGLDLYRSINSGVSFEKLEEPNTHENIISRGLDALISLPVDQPMLYGASNRIGFFVSSDLGNAWKPINNGFPNLGYMPSVLTLGSVSPTVLYAATVGEVWHYAIRSIDFSQDGKIDFDDFILFASGFGKQESDPKFDERFDFDGNKSVDFTDFIIFAQSYAKE